MRSKNKRARKAPATPGDHSKTLCLSGRALAREIGTSHTQIQRWQADGLLPAGKIPRAAIEVAKGLAAGIDARDDLHAELAKIKGELVEARRDRERANARSAELDLGRQRGEYVLVADVRREVEVVFGAVRATLLALPGRCALQLEQLAATSDIPARAGRIEHLLADEVNLLLEGLQAAAVVESR